MAYPTNVRRYPGIDTHRVLRFSTALSVADDSDQELPGLPQNDWATGVELAGVATCARVVIGAHLPSVYRGHIVVLRLAVLVGDHIQIDLLQTCGRGSGKEDRAIANHVDEVVSEWCAPKGEIELVSIQYGYLMGNLRSYGRQTNGSHASGPLNIAGGYQNCDIIVYVGVANILLMWYHLLNIILLVVPGTGSLIAGSERIRLITGHSIIMYS